MSTITYSFIIPHHNSKNLLSRCLASIPHRNDIEIIVIDDNSREEERPQQEREDEQILYIDAAHTNGAGKARNEGMKVAKGRWLVFADCDDYFKADFLSVLDKYKDTDNDFVCYNAEKVDDKFIKDLSFKKNEIIKNCAETGQCLDFIKFQLHAPWFKMVRRKFIEKYNIVYEEVPKGNDMFFSFQVGYFAKKCVVDGEVVYVYTYNPNGITNSKRDINIYMDMIARRFKKINFYHFVNHPEWVTNNFLFWIKILKREGVCMFIKILLSYFRKRATLLKSQNVYVDSIKERMLPE